MASDDTSQEHVAKRRRVELTTVQVIASVGAAVSAAIAASVLGVAGTIAGTAVVSVVATVGNALYTASLTRGRDRLRAAQLRVLRSPTAPLDSDSEAASRSEPAGSEPDRPARGGRITPRRVALGLGGAALVFVLAIGVVSGLESIIGTSFASLFGHGDTGSTAAALFGSTGGTASTRSNSGGAAPATSASSSPSPSGSASPSGSPSPRSTTPSSPSASPTAPSLAPVSPSPLPSTVSPTPSG